MTTSYELSIRLKESGVPQEGGEYYWVKSHGDEIYRVYGNTLKLNGADGSILCRAFTLGELVREFGFPIVLKQISSDKFQIENWYSEKHVIGCSPEEAAGELLAAIKEQEKLKYHGEK